MEQTSWDFLRGDPGGEARCGINVGSQLLTSGPSAHTWLKADSKGKPRPARTTKLLSWNGTLALSFVSACALEIQDYTVKLLELTFFFNFYHKVCRNRMVALTYKLRVTCDSICYTLGISFLSFILGHLVSMISVIFAISEVIKCAYDYSPFRPAQPVTVWQTQDILWRHVFFILPVTFHDKQRNYLSKTLIYWKT